MANELAQDESLIQDFLTECEELLEQLDQDLVTLETAPEDADLLNRIFRAFHTIKGTSGFMGFTQVVDPLVHLLRNSLDHGIEMPDERQAKGKARKGTLLIEARPEGDYIVVQVRDDRAGIDPGRIGKKALEKGLVTAERLAAMSQREILDPGGLLEILAGEKEGRPSA